MSTYAEPYFFERYFPSSYRLCFAPPVGRDHHVLHMTPEEMEKRSHIDKDHFEVYVNVKDFEPNEISVKTVNEMVIVEGKQEKRGKNEIPRHFVRHFRLPEFYDSEDVYSLISDDGVLEIKAHPASQKKFRHLKETEGAKVEKKE